MSVYDYPHSEYEHNHVVTMLINEMRTLKARLEALEQKEKTDVEMLTTRIAALETKEAADVTTLTAAIQAETHARINAIADLTNHMHDDFDTYVSYNAPNTSLTLKREDLNNGKL